MAARLPDITPNPDFARLEKVLRRKGQPDRVPFLELFSNIESQVSEIIGEASGEGSGDPDPQIRQLRQHITCMVALGYDYINVIPGNFRFPQAEREKTMTAEGERGYVTATTHMIADRRDFEAYSWPEPSKIDYSPFEVASGLIPDGMKVISRGPGGVLENVMWLLGYEGISYFLYDDPQLVHDMFEAVGSRIVESFDTVASLDIVGGLVLGDDLGFKTQTLLSPGVYREYLFPWHKKIVDAVHRHGKLAILHACGNVTEIMEDIIACGWDARHSFEDVIEPVWEAKAEYGDRISVLGGFDMDKLCTMSEAQVRDHTRFLIDNCAPGGGWTLGTGNSVANYVPLANYLTMLDEGFRYGVY